MSEETKVNEELYELDKEFVKLVNKAENYKDLSKQEIDQLLQEAKSSVEFLKLIDNIKIPEEKYVVYTDGEIQLIYDEGEFFLISTTDIKSEKKKIKRKQAIDLYLEYFIKYQINPIIEKRKQAILKREKQIAEKNQNRRKTTISKEIEKKEKDSTKIVSTKKEIQQDELSL